MKFCFTLLLKLYELLELQQMFDLLPVALMMMIGVAVVMMWHGSAKSSYH